MLIKGSDMKKFTVIILIIFSIFPVFAENRWEGVTPYGYSVGKMIERYDDHSNGKQVHVNATVDFIHIYYANVLALEMAKRANNGKSVSYYCLEKSTKKATEEIELFISWSKLKAAKDSSLLQKPMTTIYPVYLIDMYPLSQCKVNGNKAME
jgi:hypothetical protein